MSVDWPYGISHDHAIPVYEQIENHVRFAVASGRLKEGDSLPSVRALAQQLAINQNTVTKAYRDLELLSIVKTRRGVGITVAPAAKAACAEQTRNMALAHLADALGECMASGVTDAAIRKAVESSLKARKLPYTD